MSNADKKIPNRLYGESILKTMKDASKPKRWEPDSEVAVCELSDEALIKAAGMMREFDTGATRNTAEGRYDPEGYMSPLVEERFSEYMLKNELQADGTRRESDNWQKGMTLESYAKGTKRHVLHFWLRHRGFEPKDPKAAPNIEEDLCAIIFNAQGYLHELLKEKVRHEDRDVSERT